jgi:sec-independent protein translocase protein TatA
MAYMGALSPGHWLIVLLVLVVLFGAKKLPEAARGLGRSARILKSEVSGLHDDEPTKSAPTPQLETKTDNPPPDTPRAASTTSESRRSPEA